LQGLTFGLVSRQAARHELRYAEREVCAELLIDVTLREIRATERDAEGAADTRANLVAHRVRLPVCR
jgi:hypothetical protein